jgi:hypothetical protein
VKDPRSPSTRVTPCPHVRPARSPRWCSAPQAQAPESSTQKVLHPICGRPALWWVLRNAKAARPRAS